jgi:hypothetical protein
VKFFRLFSMGKFDKYRYGFLIFSLFITPLFGLFSYNSGFGYDALEYFVTARSLNEGYQMYDFIPSKSWLWYVFVQWGINIFGGDFNHITITALITVLFLACGWSVYLVIKKLTKSSFQAMLAGALTLICSFFMEMNFLEPEAPIVILAVWALFFLVRNSSTAWLTGGLFLGVAMLMKSVAMFYVAGAGTFLLVEWLILRSVNFRKFFTKGFALILGFAIPLGLSLVYFHFTGKLEEHIYWSYIYPFGSYPSHTIFLAKLIIKTFWFIALIALAVLLSLKQSNRWHWKSPLFLLSFLFGVFSLLALLKSQASHYFYTAAPFFAIFVALVFGPFSERFVSKKFVISIIGFIVLVGGVTFWTRPDAVKRFLHVQSYEGDRYVHEAINKRLEEGDKALFIDFGMYFYYQGHRYPNVPFINTEMQTSDYISRNTNTYEDALKDTSLKMVIFGNRPAVIDDSTMAESPANRLALDKLRTELEKSFVPDCDSLLNLTLWIRKESK